MNQAAAIGSVHSASSIGSNVDGSGRFSNGCNPNARSRSSAWAGLRRSYLTSRYRASRLLSVSDAIAVSDRPLAGNLVTCEAEIDCRKA